MVMSGDADTCSGRHSGTGQAVALSMVIVDKVAYLTCFFGGSPAGDGS